MICLEIARDRRFESGRPHHFYVMMGSQVDELKSEFRVSKVMYLVKLLTD